MRPNVLLIDNFDSFTYNLAHYLEIAGAELTVVLNNETGILDNLSKFDALVLSPGPSRPQNAGISQKVLHNFGNDKPVLGVCLGMQIINEYFGGKTVRAPFPVHGKTSNCKQINSGKLFGGINSTFTVARYHSLICADVPKVLIPTAICNEITMAFEHAQFPWFGVQFHPESFLTADGQQMINNFIKQIHG